MPTIVGIRFKDSGKIYFFDPITTTGLQQGEAVIVETVRGPELAKVAYSPRNVAESEITGDLKPVLRRADESDFARLEMLNARHDTVIARCSEKILEHHLPMRLIKAEYSFDGSRLTFYFTSEKRVDFRLLVRDLARTFKTRIELRQIGPRDEAKLLGGIGPCGRTLCCATFLPDYARVSIKMAKDQDLPLNPSKISGVCGRLLCCLSYEHDQYLQIKAELPRKGAWVQTPDGPGEVVAVNVVRETVTVQLAESAAHEDYKPELLQEATERVASTARSRNAEGITPAVRPPPPPREPKHHGERRLLRDEIENPDVLEALAMLEDGEWDDTGERSRPSPMPRPRPQQDVQRQLPEARRTPHPEAQRPTQPEPPRSALQDTPPEPRQAQPPTGTTPPNDLPQPLSPSQNDSRSRAQRRKRRK
ncbi:MAG: hypothetical protein H7Z42_05240 [Roseiflexaceae bacterium]|nr:hypothetical protein [Roseiflexaceae bacterium]